MLKNRYSLLDVRAQELHRPIGGTTKWAAKPLIVDTIERRTFELWEALGKTELEAIKKAKKNAATWIEQQQ